MQTTKFTIKSGAPFVFVVYVAMKPGRVWEKMPRLNAQQNVEVTVRCNETYALRARAPWPHPKQTQMSTIPTSTGSNFEWVLPLANETTQLGLFEFAVDQGEDLHTCIHAVHACENSCICMCMLHMCIPQSFLC